MRREIDVIELTFSSERLFLLTIPQNAILEQCYFTLAFYLNTIAIVSSLSSRRFFFLQHPFQSIVTNYNFDAKIFFTSLQYLLFTFQHGQPRAANWMQSKNCIVVNYQKPLYDTFCKLTQKKSKKNNGA